MALVDKARIVAGAACLLFVTLFVCPKRVFCVEPGVASSVDVYWKSTHSIAAPGVTSVIVLDEEIAHAELGNEVITFAGLSRGQTVALAYVNGAPVSIVVNVIEHPMKVIPPSLLRRESELAHGTIGSDFQISNSGGNNNYALFDSFSWSQRVGDTSFDTTSQFETNNQFGGHTVNLRTGNIAYRTPGFALSLVDFSQSLTGETGEDRINQFSAPGGAGLRGASLSLYRGKNEFSVFGGTTIPYYFLALNATRDVAAFTFHRKLNERVSFFSGTSYLNIPVNVVNTLQRRDYVMQNAGGSLRLTKNLLLGAQGGISNDGKMARGDISYNNFRFSGYASSIFASQTFPLSQIQSLFSGTSNTRAGYSYRLSSRLTQGLYYDHTEVTPGLVYRYQGSSDYLSPNVGVRISRGEAVNFGYTYSRNSGGFTSTTATGNRYDVSLSSQITQRIANNAQATIGSIQDPLQITSEDRFTVRDSISLPIKSQTLLLGVEHDRVNPSLISKLNQELSLLSPALQAQFQANPSAFIDSSNFPPEVKALLAAQQPIGTTVSAAANLAIGSKLHLNPTVSFTYGTNGSQQNNWTQSVGYSLNYQFRPTLQFRSSLSNVYLFDNRQANLVRTTIFTFGFLKTFTAAPGAMLLHRERVIEGRVFRDMNINGAYNVGEPGLAGVEVRLEDGQAAITDAQGRFKFPSVSADQHEVSLALTQFHQPVRMTTRSEVEADLIQQRIAAVNFGILDFARLMGSVYNDLRFDNQRQPDSRGMGNIELLLDDGKTLRKIETSGSGDFEIDNVSPGDYKLSLNASSLPANYVAPIDSIAVHVSPVSTVVKDIPMQALRSISGRVLLRVPTELTSAASSTARLKQPLANTSQPENEKEEMIPVAGVQVTAGPSTVTTDKDGTFLLRNLPAGDLKVSIRPVRAVPDGINIPTGSLKLPAEPVQIQGATIVVSNADLLPYLTDATLQAPTAHARQAIASAYNRAHDRAKQQPSVAVSNATPKAPLPAKIVPALPSSGAQNGNVARALVPVPAPAPAQTSRPATIAPPVARGAQQNDISYDAVNRAICSSMPSLGEAAQCFNQLKRNAATTPQK